MISININKIIYLLKTSKLVAIPTETVYGLAASGLDIVAVEKIFKAKGRPSYNPLILHIHSFDEIRKYVSYIPENAKTLALHFWPGPLTIVLPKKGIVPDIVTAGLPDVAIRVPNHPLTLALLKELDFPLAAPSANPFGYVSPTTAQHVKDQLGDKVDYILDGGPCKIGLESTVVAFDGETPIILRPGGITKEQIEELLGIEMIVKKDKQAKIQSPGMLDNHYAPVKQLVMGNIPDLLTKYTGIKTAIISFHRHYGDNQLQWTLSPSCNLDEAASNLFAVLREADNSNAEIILCERVPDERIGIAINDRLMRASTK